MTWAANAEQAEAMQTMLWACLFEYPMLPSTTALEWVVAFADYTLGTPLPGGHEGVIPWLMVKETR